MSTLPAASDGKQSTLAFLAGATGLALAPDEVPSGSPGMTWPERIENYRRVIGTPHLGCEDGWCTGTWVLGNSYGKKTDYYGAYQGNFLKRIAALFPDRRRVLHLFAGKVDLAAFPGDTLDINPELKPTWCCNAETCDGVPLADYDFVLADPPYSETDAEKYHASMVNRNKVVRILSESLPVGAYVVWLDQVYPMYAKIRLKPEALIGIVGSTNHRFRVLTVFRRTDGGSVSESHMVSTDLFDAAEARADPEAAERDAAERAELDAEADGTPPR